LKKLGSYAQIETNAALSQLIGTTSTQLPDGASATPEIGITVSFLPEQNPKGQMKWLRD
jgi:hypothetical protein